MDADRRNDMPSSARRWARALLAGSLLLAGSAGFLGGTIVPAEAQFFDFFRRPPGSVPNAPQQQRQRYQQQQGGFGFPFFGGQQNNHYQTYERDDWRQWREPRRIAPREAQQQQGDFSKAPPPRKPDVEPPTTVVVLGDSMADWLSYGLEDAFGDTGDVGVTRKHKTGSGLIKGEGREAYDWVQSARDILAAEKADFVVMMIGLGDRHAIRERTPPPRPLTTGQKPADGKPTDAPKAAEAKPGEPAKPPATAKPAEKPAETAKQEDATDAEAGADQPAAMAPEQPAAPARGGTVATHEFRSEKWVELYGKRVDEAIAAMKAKRVPVIWVGLPPIRGAKSRQDLAFLNAIYKDRAEKAGIPYVDVWDGFIEEGGDFTQYGPDVLGQVRRLRAGDGVHFTKPGARKLAHYVEREIRRLMTKAVPVALPMPEDALQVKPGATNTAPAIPSGPAPRPVAGPVIPLTGATPAAEALAGGGQTSQVTDPVAVRVLVKGEAIDPARGRVDDFTWPRPAATTDEPPPLEQPRTATRPAPSVPPAQRPAATTPRPSQQRSDAQGAATTARAVR